MQPTTATACCIVLELSFGTKRPTQINKTLIRLEAKVIKIAISNEESTQKSKIPNQRNKLLT